LNGVMEGRHGPGLLKSPVGLGRSSRQPPSGPECPVGITRERRNRAAPRASVPRCSQPVQSKDPDPSCSAAPLCTITAYPPAIGYLTPAALKLRNRSLKSELIFMDASRSRGGNYQVPGRFADFRGAELLPERDIELASRRTATHRSRHHDPFPIRHSFYYRMSAATERRASS
jgi:hypothetical protein